MDRFQDAINVILNTENASDNKATEILSNQLDTLKKTSNDLYREGAFYEAVTGYTSAMRLLMAAKNSNLDLTSNKNAKRHVLLANRAACYMNFVPIDANNAERDLKEVLRIEPNYVKGWLRLVRFYAQVKNTQAKIDTAKKGLVYHSDNEELMNIVATFEENEEVNENSSFVKNVDQLKGDLRIHNKSSKKETEQTAEEKVEALRKMMLGL
jgi:predicted Zn-dependent protease